MLVSSAPNDIVTISGTTLANATQTDQQSTSSISKGAISKITVPPTQSTAARPDDLGVTPWYFEDYPNIDSSPGPTGDRSSYPSYLYTDKDIIARADLTSTRNSSIESEFHRQAMNTAPRKAYMDLTDAIALLDETCPNQEPSPSLTPRTPRTPLTPYPRNKRARSKSSDNSSNYSNDRLSDRSFDTIRPHDKEKKRPFLKKIGISKTEDKPFLAILAPKLKGKPYLEKIGPSKAVERPFLEKIGSSKTLDKFIFETPRYDRKSGTKCDPDTVKEEVVKEIQETVKEEQEIPDTPMVTDIHFTTDRRRSGKGTLLKMYSFETEDLESTVYPKGHRDPLRGASLDDVIDSGPNSLPMENTEEKQSKPESKERSPKGAELLKCRVTTSEEIIFTNVSFGSPREPNSWGNSPRKKWRLMKDNAVVKTPTHQKDIQTSREGPRSNDSTPSSPIKRPITNASPERQIVSLTDKLERNIFSPAKTRRQTFEDISERNGKSEDNTTSNNKQVQFERRGISSDNLLSKDRLLTTPASDLMEKARETSSEDSLACRGVQEYTKETFKQLQDKFKFHEIPTETYADFKRRTRGNLHSTLGRVQANIATSDTWENIVKDSALRTEGSPKTSTLKAKSEDEPDVTCEVTRSGTIRSVLRKQERIEQPCDQESDTNASLRRPKRRIFHEPSQETMDLLAELKKVKSLLKTPSWEKDLELDNKPTRLPKRILLTDKEFCLSVERENSIRRPSKVINTLEKTEEGISTGKEEETKENGEKDKNEIETQTDKHEIRIPGPALFEKKCLSLDYADEEKPQKPEVRTISLASARNLPSETDVTIDYSYPALVYDSKSYSSDVFNTPTEETNEKERTIVEPDKNVPKKVNRNHCTEVDIAIPIDQKVSSPKVRVEIQGMTSDLYEIISPRSTPFRVKKRLGKISVEDTVKPESFTLGSKIDCRLAVTQKRTKCFPL